MLTAFSTVSDTDPTMTGYEEYPVIGSALTDQEITKIIRNFSGLKTHWNCLEKAQIVVALLGKGLVTIGSLQIVSGDLKSMYGYEYHPPREFHAWVTLGKDIIDIALPGVILKGLNTRDEYGPFIVDRKPAVLAGKAPEWAIYRGKEILE